jgi:hypothetical protein
MFKPLEWSKQFEPTEEIRYNHVIADTPFGRFLITWKGWKLYDSCVVDETPWGDWYAAFNSLDEAKQACSDEFNRLLKSCLT